MTEYKAEEIKGRPVIDKRGTTLGDVQDLVFDPDRWEVRGVLVNLRKEIAEDLNIQKPAFGSAQLSISRDRVGTFGDNVMLNVDRDDIASLLRGGGTAGTRMD